MGHNTFLNSIVGGAGVGKEKCGDLQALTIFSACNETLYPMKRHLCGSKLGVRLPICTLWTIHKPLSCGVNGTTCPGISSTWHSQGADCVNEGPIRPMLLYLV